MPFPKRFALLLTLLAVGALAAPAAEADVLTPEVLAQVRSATGAVISPDGRLIAYRLVVPRTPFEDDDGPSWSELHIVDMEGGDRAYISGEVNVGSVKWSPTGELISWIGKRGDDESAELYAIPVAGGESRKIVTHPESILEYAWSPDGKRIAFVAEEKDDEEREKLEKKGFKARIYEEEWKQERIWIAALGDEPAEGTVLDIGGTASGISWSPDGESLVALMAPTSLIDDHYMKRRIRVIDVDRGEIAARIENPGKIGVVKWSPNGRYLAFISAADANDPSAGRLMVAPAAGGEMTNLLPELDNEGQVEAIAWQDDDFIMYVASRGVWTELGKVDRTGKRRKTIVPTGGPILRSLSLSKDGQRGAMIADSPTHPAEVYTMSHGDAAPRRLTDSNPILEGIRLARQEPIRYKARDGLEIEALLVHPLDETKDHPLIVVVHGGPESHYSNGWNNRYSSPGQTGAARGFAVLYPNYRGSTGRGVAFSKRDQAAYARPEFDDLVDGAEHLIESGLVARGKVGITGGSYGGFASAWGATALSEHFQASVVFVGISDQISKFGTTDIPNEMFAVHARRWPWDSWDWYRERSPIYHVENSDTPTLILHGEEDTRVPTSQSMELYRYMKVLGKTVRLVLYPGEGHGNRKAAARYDYSLRQLRWMEHYLVGEGGAPPPKDLDYPLNNSEGEDDE